MRWTSFAILSGLLALGASPALAQARLVVLEGGPARGPVQARLGEAVRVGVRIGREALPAGSRVEWLRVVPRLQHVELEPQNEGDRTYSNAVLGGERHGRWIGHDELEYTTEPLAGRGVHGEGAELRLEGAPAPPSRAETTPRRSAPLAGTIWLAARVTLPDGRIVATPGAPGEGAEGPEPPERDRDRLGLRERVLRVSFRTGDGFLGWLSSYFDVPYVFGSTPPQSERYTGIDCADVLVGARRRETGRRLRYTSVQGIERLARAVSDPLRIGRDGVVRDGEGEPVELRWGEDVRAGDMLAIDYAADEEGLLPRAWDHIGALLADRSEAGPPDGVLDGQDLLRHMSRRGLTDEPLWRHGPIRIRVWRWR
ncbi:MAG TPA: hypothetical protein RMH85_00595 [Polyangiaceae bacterium LLY-WYZ-15_(1-7)]|nr:hypothetical protein [Myxococcales bacterium]MAT27970.1 hypothetical protein [Sandaracinus sp.]HJK90906.1 hypothetical protein [Polyangiaceae bacterium LLY-WYZ-15_(1-7)]MBJ71244.1 hypothetical protein [Sandaracinus sp.]HJL06116.1 hypothetical protein [Polyangiaceae bacterium LLY-WYZ-15_(1-7)]